jgi:hypothetical protein
MTHELPPATAIGVPASGVERKLEPLIETEMEGTIGAYVVLDRRLFRHR